MRNNNENYQKNSHSAQQFWNVVNNKKKKAFPCRINFYLGRLFTTHLPSVTHINFIPETA